MPKVTLTKPKVKDPVRHMVRSRLDDLDMTQTALSQKMGVSDTSIGNWLADPNRITLGNLRKMGRVLGMRVEIRLEEQ